MNENFMKKMFEMVKKMAEIGEDDRKDWVQIAKLDPADIGRRKSLFAESDAIKDELGLYQAKIEALMAKQRASSDEWWHHLKTKYGIPRRANLHIEDDGRIIMDPRKEENNG